MADLLIEGARTLTFVRSRRGAELTAMGTKRLLAEVDPDLAERVAPYRAGYLAEDRRELEAALADGTLLGVATTNALELGVDIAGLDAVVVAGFPGTVASFWQQAGRSGRRGEGSLVVLVARDDPLDTYLVHHPAALLDKPVEATVTDPGPTRTSWVRNLLCAAMELPLSDAEVDEFGAARGSDRAVRGRPDPAPNARMVRHRRFEPPRLRWTFAAASELRSPSSTVNPAGCWVRSMPAARRPQSTRVPCTSTRASRSSSTIWISTTVSGDWCIPRIRTGPPRPARSPRSRSPNIVEHKHYGDVAVALVQVEVTHQVVGYLRRLPSGEVLDSIELDMPAQTLHTRAVMYTITPELLRSQSGSPPERFPGSLHAAEHAAIGLLPLVATCDRGDIGGVSTALHADTGLPDGVRLRRPRRRRRVRRPRPQRTVATGSPRRATPSTPASAPRMPVVRPFTQVRQRKRPARQGRRGQGSDRRHRDDQLRHDQPTGPARAVGPRIADPEARQQHRCTYLDHHIPPLHLTFREHRTHTLRDRRGLRTRRRLTSVQAPAPPRAERSAAD